MQTVKPSRLPTVILITMALLATCVVAAMRYAEPSIAAPAAKIMAMKAKAPSEVDAATASITNTQPTAATSTARQVHEASLERGIAEAKITPLDSLHVRVESTDSNIEGLPIALTHTDQTLITDVIGVLQTNEQGHVRIARSWCVPRDPDASTCIDAAFPTIGAYAMQLEPHTQHANLFVPARGSLRIEVVEADGSATTQRASAQVKVLNATPPADRIHRLELHAGNARIDVEAAALLLQVHVETLHGRSAEAVTAIGPAMPGEVKVLTLRLPPRAMFSARLLDATGQPLRNTAVDVRVAATSIRLGGQVTTNASGVVTFPVPDRFRQQAQRLVFQAHSRTGSKLRGELFAALANNPTILGDVWLRHPPQIAAGICLDEQGAPLPGMQLSLQVEATNPQQNHNVFGSRFTDVAINIIKTRPDGTFAIHGPDFTNRSLRLSSRRHPNLAITFAPGDSNLQFLVPTAKKHAPTSMLRTGARRHR